MKVKELKNAINKLGNDEAEVYICDPTSGSEGVMSAARVCKNNDGSVTLISCSYIVASKKVQKYVENCAIDMEG